MTVSLGVNAVKRPIKRVEKSAALYVIEVADTNVSIISLLFNTKSETRIYKKAIQTIIRRERGESNSFFATKNREGIFRIVVL